MNPVGSFLVGIGVTAVVSAAVVRYLKPSLQDILTDLCGTAQRAAFWTAFSNVTLGLTPVVFAMHYRPDHGDAAPAVFAIGSQLEWALAGLLVSVMMLGFILSRFITKQDRTHA
jgi:hypothetical protein